MQLRFVHSPRSNAFFRDLMEGLAGAVSALGVPASITPTFSGPADIDCVDVLVPHEYFGNADKIEWPSSSRRRRTITLVTEHPGTPFFDMACLAATDLAATVALNRSAVAAARHRGVAAEHLQLGYVPSWDEWHGEPRERPVDITYLGVSDARRNRLIAGYGDILPQWRTSLLIPPFEVKPDPHAQDFLLGPAKWKHLAASRVLINIHRAGVGDTEWPRVIEAICNGAVVVTEHCLDIGPLEPGVHYFSGEATRLAELADIVLRDPDRQEAVRQDAYSFIKDQLPIRQAARQLADLADLVLSRARRPSLRTFVPPVNPRALSLILHPRGSRRPADPAASLLPVLKRLVIEVTDLRRQQAAMRLAFAGIDPEGVELLHTTPGHADQTPDVTVIMPVFNQETDVREALESLLKSDCDRWEVVVLDDGSQDATRAVVAGFFDAHPEVAGQLLAATTNHGIGWARNRAIEHARAELLFMLDGDNAVYPRTLSRLVQALRDDPGAAMAYPVVGTHTPAGPEGLISHMAWRPALFATGVNPVDAMALVRRSVMADLGGFSEDPRLGGFEDYDLWCRMPSHGMYGLSVPELLGWYRRSKHSALSVADLDRTEALSLISRRAPNLFSAS